MAERLAYRNVGSRGPSSGVRRRPRVLIVEDEPRLIALLRREVETIADPVCASSLAEARRHLEAAGGSWSAVLLDESLPDGTGTSLLEDLHRLHPNVPVVFVTGDPAPELSAHILKHRAFLLPKPLAADWVVALEGVMIDPHAELRAHLSRVGLRDREIEVFVELAQGYTAEEVAARLVVSPATVRSHTARVYTRLGVRSLPALIALAFGW